MDFLTADYVETIDWIFTRAGRYVVRTENETLSHPSTSYVDCGSAGQAVHKLRLEKIKAERECKLLSHYIAFTGEYSQR